MPPPDRQRPTVCQVLHSLGVGGAEVLATRLARRLGDHFRFVFACLDELGTLGQELRDEGFEVEVLGRRPGLDWRCPLRLAAFCRRHRAGLIHAHQYTPFLYSLLSRQPFRRPPILFTEHGRQHPDYPRRKRVLANRLLLRRRDRVVGVGEAVRQALIQNEGIPARRVGVVYNGIDLAPFAEAGRWREEVRQELRIQPGELMILQVARLDRLKDHATALRTIERVGRERPEARLVLAGAGPEEAAVRAEIERRNLGPFMRVLGLRKDVARLTSAADIFLLTSISEGIPLTLVEAMTACLPVVSTDVGGVPEVIQEGKQGLLAPAGDDAALARHILQLASDPTLRAGLGRQGRERARSLFSEETMHLEYEKLYREMLDA